MLARRELIKLSAATMVMGGGLGLSARSRAGGLPNLSELRQENHIPAIGLAYKKRGEPAVILTDGVRSNNAVTPVSPQDIWHIGSNAKSMTAALVGRLVEKGRIGWDLKLTDVAGLADNRTQDGYRAASLRHFFSHRTGMPIDISDFAALKYSQDDTIDPRPERLAYAREALAQKPMSELGAQWAYSNNGYIVAAAMIEAVTGRSWEDLMRAEVFEPLGLTTAGFGAPGTPNRLDQPVGHKRSLFDPGHWVPQLPGLGKPTDDVIAFGPAGRVHMSLGDLMTYLEVHSNHDPAYLSRETWHELHHPAFGGDYAMGLYVKPGIGLWHNGTNSAWYAETLINSKAGMVSAAVANADNHIVRKIVAKALNAGAMKV